MKIGVDIRDAQDARKMRAGKGVYARELIKELLSIDSENEYVLYARDSQSAPQAESLAEDFFSQSRARVQVKVSRAPGLLWHIVVALRMWLYDRVDLFFAPTSYIIPFLFPRKCVVVVHDVYALIAPERHLKKAVAIEKRTFKRAITRARAVVAVSEFTKREVMRLTQLQESSITVVPNAVRQSPAPAPIELSNAETFMSRFNIPDRYVLFVGTLEPRKNIFRLIEAFAIFKKKPQAADFKLVIAGNKGWYYDEIFQAAQAVNLTNDIIFTGYVSEAEKNALYKKAAVFVFPSLYEGFGIPPLEAMSAGTPVVTSSTSSLPEVVGDAAICVDPTHTQEIADAIEQVLGNEQLRNELVEKGHRQVELFSWEKSAQALRSLLKHI